MRSAHSGQALVTLLVMMILIITVSISSVYVIGASLRGTTSKERFELSVLICESGLENAILRILRTPSYTGETLTFSDGTVDITVTGGPSYVVLCTANVDSVETTLEADTDVVNNVLTVTSWKTIYP